MKRADPNIIVVVLHYPARDEQRVEVKGSWDGWNGTTSLKKHGSEWVGTVDVIPGSHSFKFIVDGRWCHLESFPHVVQDGNTNNIMTIGTGTRTTAFERTIRVVSFNIRYDNPKDAPLHWQARVDPLCSALLYSRADFICLQEAKHHQLHGVLQRLQGLYQHVGVGRDDGQTAGEYSPILYLASRFAPMHSATFWLSDTPTTPGSRGWGARLPRICSLGVFIDLITQRRLLVANTHLDHEVAEARLNGMQLIVDQIAQLPTDLAILTGDWNDTPQSQTYNCALSRLVDSRSLAKRTNHEWTHTFCNFVPLQTYPHPRSDCTIDYVFVSPGTKVSLHSILGVHQEGTQLSDHRPVVVDLEI